MHLDDIHMPSNQMVYGWRIVMSNIRELRPSRLKRKNHDQSWLCRPWSCRSDGSGRVPLEPYRFHPDGDPESARTSCRRRRQSNGPQSLDLGLRTTAARISKRCSAPARCCTSMFWALPASRKTSRPSLLAPPSPQSPCWAHCMPVRRSRPPWPTGHGEGDAEPGHHSEATRLTRAGQLVEATALLQRMLAR